MTVVFDPLRLAEVAWDVGSANAQTPLAIERRQRERLTALLDSPGGVRWLQACMPGREADGVVLQDLVAGACETTEGAAALMKLIRTATADHKLTPAERNQLRRAMAPFKQLVLDLEGAIETAGDQ